MEVVVTIPASAHELIQHGSHLVVCGHGRWDSVPTA